MQPNGIQLTNVQATRGEGGLVSLQVEVAPASVADARARVIKEFSKRIRVPGFRPGSIPAGIVRRNVGDQAIAEEVSDLLVPAAYQAAVEQANVAPLERAEVDELELDPFSSDKPMTFVARVIVRPEIQMGSTEGLSAVKRSVQIVDEDVEQALNQMREEAAYLKNAPERPVEDGDVLFADVQVYVDGAPRSEEPANLRGFVVGQSGFVPAIDSELVGMNLDETKKFPMSYPEDFPDEELRGKEAEFEVKVTAVKERVVPEITDEFAQIRQAENVADLRAKLTDYLAQTGERESRKDVRESITKQVVDASELELPTALVDLRLQERIQGIEQELAQNGATMDAYLNAINSTREQLDEDLREEIGAELKTELVLDEIAKQQEFPVANDEIEQHYLLMANVTNTPPEELVKNVPVQNVVVSIRQRKAIDFLISKAQIEDEQGQVISLDTPAMMDEAEEALEDAEAEAMLDEMDEDDFVDEDVVESEGGTSVDEAANGDVEREELTGEDAPPAGTTSAV